MNTSHLTEMQLQLYADNTEYGDADLKKHAAQCLHCQTKLENYRLISSALKTIPVQAFEFDVAEEVLASVAVKNRKAPIAWVPLLAATIGALLVIMMASLYMGQMATWFLTLPKAWRYMLTFPVLVFLVVQLIASVTEHQRKMNLLLGK